MFGKPSFYCYHPLLKKEILLAVPPNHAFQERAHIRLQEAADESFISLKKRYGFRELTDQYYNEAGFTPKLAVKCDEPSALSRLVKAGLGVAFLPFAAKREDPTLHLLPNRKSLCQWTLYLTWKEQDYFSKAALLFREFVIRFFEKVEQIDWC